MHFKPVESVLCPYNQFLQSPDPKQLQCKDHYLAAIQDDHVFYEAMEEA